MFSKFKQAMQANFAFMLAQSQQSLYLADVDKDELWNTYLSNFPVEEQQEHNCNCCRSFIKHYGNVVMIINNKMVTMWDFPCEAPFDKVASSLHALVSGHKVYNVFVPDTAKLGTDKTPALLADGTATIWQHMFIQLPAAIKVHKSATSVESVMGEKRNIRNVFKRSLDEITLNSVDTVLELIAQNTLYRGVESKGVLLDFKNIKEAYNSLPESEKENYCWTHASNNSVAVTKIRNTAIGTLLVNLSEDMDLELAVSKFEQVMAPSNYKRPNAIITKKTIELAEATIEELGFKESLGRRFANPDDITVNNLVFVDRNKKKSSGLLSDLKDTVPVNVKSLTRVEEVPVAVLVGNILPLATSLEILFENKNINNLVSLITAKDKVAPSMFKWPNNFSWSYKDGVADSIKERVKAAGGNVTGYLRASLSWFNYDDLDLHMVLPNRETIFFSKKRSTTGGYLDVDMNAGGGSTRQAVENIAFPAQSNMIEGIYTVKVNQFHKLETIDFGFELELECDGVLRSFSHPKMLADKAMVEVVKFEYTKSKGITIISSIEGNEKITTKNVWGIDTNKFHKVSMAMMSPNYWDGSHVGNPHLFFMIPGAHNDEKTRGFLNEFLDQDLDKHKRVFEALGSRSEVAPIFEQLSGLGFSATNHDEVIVKVEGTFSRTLKVKF